MLKVKGCIKKQPPRERLPFKSQTAAFSRPLLQNTMNNRDKMGPELEFRHFADKHVALFYLTATQLRRLSTPRNRFVLFF